MKKMVENLNKNIASKKLKLERGVSPFIASVLTVLFGVIMLGIVLTVVNPTFKRAQDSSVISDAFQNLEVLNSAIKEVASEAQGSKRTVSLSVSDGEYSINATTDSLIFTYDPYKDMGLTGTKGDIQIEHGSVFTDFFNWYVDGSKAQPVWTNTSGQWIVSNYKYRGNGGLAYHNLSTIENYKFEGKIYNVSGGTGGQIFVTPTNPESLAGFWSFDNRTGSKAYDWSGNGNNGTLTNMNTTGNATSGWTTDCKYGSCLKFDGVDDYVEVPDSDSLDLVKNDTVPKYTFVAWIYWRGPGKAGGYGSIFQKRPTSSGEGGYGFYVDNTAVIGAYTHNGTSWNSGPSSSKIEKNKWYYVAVTFDGRYYKFYINGNYDSTYDLGTTITLLTNNDPLTIGKQRPTSDYEQFNGTIDEVRIYNRALTAEEVAAEYELSAKKLHASGSQSVSAKTPNAAIVLANPDGVTNFDNIKVSRTQKEQKLVIPYSKIDLNGTLRVVKGEHQVVIKHMGTNATLSKPIIEVTAS